MAKKPPRLKMLAPRLQTLSTSRLSPMAPDKSGRRQFATNSTAWRRIRDQVIKRDKFLCADCGIFCTGSREAHVDHIDGDAWNNDLSNLITRCASCHSKKTAGRDGGFGNPTRG